MLKDRKIDTSHESTSLKIDITIEPETLYPMTQKSSQSDIALKVKLNDTYMTLKAIFCCDDRGGIQ